VALMRPEVVTHVANADQRLLQLDFKVLGTYRLEINGPRSRAHMSSGYCLLFVLDQDGTPSVGKFVHVE